MRSSHKRILQVPGDLIHGPVALDCSKPGQDEPQVQEQWQAAVRHAAVALEHCIVASRGLGVSAVCSEHLTNNEIDDNGQPAHEHEHAQLQCHAACTMSQAACSRVGVPVMPPCDKHVASSGVAGAQPPLVLSSSMA